MKIKENLLTLKETDMWSLVLFALYKVRDLPEMSTISELAYVLDKDSVLKLCEYFGGMTIKIPTVEELENLVYALVLYQYVNLGNMAYDDAIKLIGKDEIHLRAVKSAYSGLCKILDKYEFRGRTSV